MEPAEIVSLLLRETINIDAVDETDKTALALASKLEFEKAVEFLINSVDLRHDHGQEVFLLMIERDWHVAEDGIIMRARAKVDEEAYSAERDQISLLLAVYDGDVDKVRQITEERNLDLKSAHHKIGEVSLFLAVERQDIAMTQSLLDLFVDVNAKDSLGQTSLHRATRRKNESLIKLLLIKEAMIDCKDDDGRTPWSANLRSWPASPDFFNSVTVKKFV